MSSVLASYRVGYTLLIVSGTLMLHEQNQGLKMLRVGLTGGVASGKSTVAELFAAQGVPIIDCDLLARELTATGSAALKQIAQHFGPEILKGDGSLNRRQLRSLILAQPAQRQWLEKLLHPLIRAEIRARLSKIKAPYCLIVIPLLSEAQGIDYVDQIVVVDTAPELQLQRLQQRDGCSLEEAKNLIAAQHSREQRLQIAHEVIHNTGDLNALVAQVNELHHRFSQA